MLSLANEQHFQSVYLDLATKDWKKCIVFHDPVYEQETPGVVALKSLRLEDTYGFVVSAPVEVLKQFRARVKEIDAKIELGKQEPEKILSKLLETAKAMNMTLSYVQNGKQGGAIKAPALDDKTIASINKMFVERKAMTAIAKAAIVTAALQPTTQRPDPQLLRQVMHHNCIWIGNDVNKSLAMRPVAQTRKFSIYRAGGSSTATAKLDKPPIEDPDFMSVVREAKAKLRSLGWSSRLILDNVTIGQNGYAVGLVLDAKVVPNGDLPVTAGFTSVRSDFHEIKIGDRAKLSVQNQDGLTRVFLSYETGLSPSRVTEASLVRHYFRTLKGASPRPGTPL